MSELKEQFLDEVHWLIRPALVGVWTLRSFTETTERSTESSPLGLQPRGLLMYTMDGFVSAQLMNPSRTSLASGEWNCGTPEEYQEIGSGYIGYSGHFEVDEEHAIVTHLPEVSLFPNFIGKRQQRLVNLCGDKLTLTTSHKRKDGEGMTSRLQWMRMH